MARIQMTPMVRIALWALRIYLLVLLSLIGLKFVRGFKEARTESGPGAQPAVPITHAPPAR